jgi:hypothetical protein
MADPQPNPNAPLTEEAFLIDRQRMYSAFGGMTFYGTAFVVILLILMAIFLL